jgi:hypothetical protein
MNRTKLVSFPRSGHGLVVSVLARYFGNELNYCEKYLSPELTLERNEKTNLQKEHDFKLDTPIESEINHIIQIRNPKYAIPSWFSFVDKKESPVCWDAFSDYAISFWEKWTNKWIINNYSKKTIIYYEEIVEYPEESFCKIISSMKTDAIDRGILNHIILEENIKNQTKKYPFNEKEWEEKSKSAVITYQELKPTKENP